MILDSLVNGQIQLSKSERKIASFILKNPSKIINQSISSLAKDAGVSLPSVNRFCKKLGFGGYPALKIQLAQELSSNNRLLAENFKVDKDTPDIVKRVMSDIQATVINVGQNLDSKSIDSATNLIATAKSLNFFGLGGSGPVALDAQNNAAGTKTHDMPPSARRRRLDFQGDVLLTLNRLHHFQDLQENMKN